MNFTKKLMVRPGTNVKLKDFDPGDTLGYQDDKKTQAKLAKHLQRLDDLQYLFYAVKQRALLIVLQGIDTGGKDGTIRHVMSGMSPQGCQRDLLQESLRPTKLAHDFLWRIHAAVPEQGMFGIFNRSHYEDVLVVRVHKLVPKKVWKARYDEINAFEKLLVGKSRPHRQVFPAHQQGRTEKAPRGAAHRSAQILENLGGGFCRAQVLGRLRRALTRMPSPAAALKPRRGSSFPRTTNGFGISPCRRSWWKRWRASICSFRGHRWTCPSCTCGKEQAA